MNSKRRRSRMIVILSIIVVLLLAAVIFTSGTGGSYKNSSGHYREITARKSYQHVLDHPLLNGWGDEIITWKSPTVKKIISPLSIGYISSFMGYNKGSVIEGMNYLIRNENAGNLQSISFYSGEDIAEDPTKESTGMLYIPGDINKPFAVVVAGGAFQSVAMLMESFPVAKVLSEEGYPVFILKYRIGKDETAQEPAQQDTAAAMKYIFSNMDEIGIINEKYSMWGFSAGGRLIYLWGEGDEYSCSSIGLPAPQMLALVYGALWDDHNSRNPQTATYMCYGKNDVLIGEKGIKWSEEHMAYLKSIGTDVRFDLFDDAPHGFGDGKGTDAENWMKNAIELLISVEMRK